MGAAVRRFGAATSLMLIAAISSGCATWKLPFDDSTEEERMATALREIGRCDPAAVDAAVALLRTWAIRLPHPQTRMLFVGAAELLRYYCSSTRDARNRQKLVEDLGRLERMLEELARSNDTQEQQIRELRLRLKVQRDRRTCGEFRYQTPDGCKDKRHP